MYAQAAEVDAIYDLQLIKIRYLWKRPSRKITFRHTVFLVNKFVPLISVLIFALPLLLPTSYFKSCAVYIIITQLSFSAKIFMSTREATLCLLVIFRILSRLCSVILTIRLCVAWKHNRVVVVLAYLNLGTLTTVSLLIFAISYIRNKRVVYGEPVSLSHCLEVESLNWVPLPLLVATESVSILLLGYRRYKDTRGGSNLLVCTLYRALVDDGLLYYSYSIILALVDSVLFFYLKNRVIALGIAALDTDLHSITTMYICIHLRYVDDKERMKREKITSDSEEIQFADNISHDSGAV
ncbi:hypothetical protein PNOK_0655200 [Pyrrhoderma noxium]|uniref:Uncharacterized protein n=1 Tax=Pyrrhoderma noxium TaxID=2282107 RepID=A0A286UEN4_9AGAM|nr:hypothetical protein PNOK_0655200 [Pyrrhoderma noxium]